MRSRPGHFVDLRLKQRVKQVPGQAATPRGGSGEGGLPQDCMARCAATLACGKVLGHWSAEEWEGARTRPGLSEV